MSFAHRSKMSPFAASVAWCQKGWHQISTGVVLHGTNFGGIKDHKSTVSLRYFPKKTMQCLGWYIMIPGSQGRNLNLLLEKICGEYVFLVSFFFNVKIQRELICELFLSLMPFFSWTTLSHLLVKQVFFVNTLVIHILPSYIKDCNNKAGSFFANRLDLSCHHWWLE